MNLPGLSSDFLEPDAADAIRVVVAGPSPAVRAGLRAMLGDQQEIIVVGELPPGLGDEDRVRAADVFVIQLPERGDAARVREILPDGSAVVFVGAPSVPESHQQDRGPSGYVSADVDAPALGAAVHAVAAGLTVFDAPMFASVRLTPSGPRDATEVTLTPRELEVLEAIALGLPNKGIAARLGISEHTAKFHVGSILAELGASSRTEAVMIATRKGILSI